MAKAYITNIDGVNLDGSGNPLLAFEVTYIGADVPNTINGYSVSNGIGSGFFNGNQPDISACLTKEETLALAVQATKDYATSLSFTVSEVFVLA